MSRALIKNSARFISEYKPDLIVAPHPSTLHFVVATNKINDTSIPVVGIDIEPFEGGDHLTEIYTDEKLTKKFDNKSGNRVAPYLYYPL